ncbi:hypothetical protein [Sideroxydans sp.]
MEYFNIYYCDGKTSYQSENSIIFEEDSILSKKRVTHIMIKAKNRQSLIEIELSHGENNKSRVLVQGIDSTWVNGTLRKVEESIESFKPQCIIIKKYKWLALPVIALGIGILFTFLIGQLPIKQSDNASLIYKYFLSFIIGLAPASILYEKLSNLWPSIELQIGPEHTFIEKNRRNYFALVIILGVVPLLTSLTYDVIKLFAIAT